MGTFGTTVDPMQGLGACYRLVVRATDCSDRLGGAALERDIIAQSVNTGFDVSNIQFDLQMGNGGTGAFNNCAGDDWSMFPGQTPAQVSPQSAHQDFSSFRTFRGEHLGSSVRWL